MSKSLAELKSVRAMTAAKKCYRAPPFAEPQKAKDFIPLMVTGGLGDLIVALPLIRDISMRVGKARMWCNHPDAAEFLVKNTFGFKQLSIERDPFPGFDFWLKINSLSRFEFERNFNGFCSPMIEGMYLSWFSWAQKEKWKHIFRFHPGLDNEAAHLAVEEGMNRASLPAGLLGLNPLPLRIQLDAGPYDWEPFITVHDGYDLSQANVPVRATKTWNIRHWMELVRMIKELHPNLIVVQLGSKNSREIPGVDVQLIGKTTIAESLKILSRSKMHIDGDSGLVHAARTMAVRSVVLFGPTPADFFGYRENINIQSSFCADCFWLVDNWMDKCARGFGTPRCMDSIYPKQVYQAAIEILNGAFNGAFR